ncbi:hypothetical protein Hanom_Chr17g01535681 [Helianthus anomalus]
MGKERCLVIMCHVCLFVFFNGKFWITDGPLEYHRVTSGTTRLYPYPLGILLIHQFRRKPNKYGKNPFCGNRTQDLLVPKPYSTPKMPLGYKAMSIMCHVLIE